MHTFLSMPATTEEEVLLHCIWSIDCRLSRRQTKWSTEFFSLAETTLFTCAQIQLVFPPRIRQNMWWVDVDGLCLGVVQVINPDVLIDAHILILHHVRSLSLISHSPPEGRPGDFWCLRAASLIPLFYISSLVLLPSPAAISVLSFSAFGLFSWSVFP